MPNSEDKLVGKKIEPVPNKPQEIGIGVFQRLLQLRFRAVFIVFQDIPDNLH